MAVKKIYEFVEAHRNNFCNEHSNVFVTCFAKIAKKAEFLEIILTRHSETTEQFMSHQRRARDIFRPPGGTITHEQAEIFAEGRHFYSVIQLDIETFYLFAKILLDDIARSIEYYFGPSRRNPLDSHDDLSKNLESYVIDKKLVLSNEMANSIRDLRRRVADFRDQQVAHEKSPRSIDGLMWNIDGNVRLMRTRIFPKDRDSQVESENLRTVMRAIDTYIEQFLSFIATNRARSNLKASAPD